MNRWKEFSYVLSLGILFIVTVNISLSISEKPDQQQRIPHFEKSDIELSGLPLNVLRELITTELFQLKNQAFINQLKELNTSTHAKNQLDKIQIDLSKAMTIIVLKEPSVPNMLLHFKAKTAQFASGKYYIQSGYDVFYSPVSNLSKAQAKWIESQVKWEDTRIEKRQFIVHQQINGTSSIAQIDWDESTLHYRSNASQLNQTIVLSPRYFHLSQTFPNSILPAIPSTYPLRHLLIDLERYSVNYEGGALSDDESFPFSPSFEALLEYKNPQDLDEALSAVRSAYDTLTWKEQEVKMGSKTYFFKLTSPKTLYICSNKEQFCPNGNPNVTRCNYGFLCKGDLGRLTSIKNTGWAGLVLDMIPAFRASKELFDGTTEIQSSNKGLDITFKPGSTVLHQLLKTLVVYSQE